MTIKTNFAGSTRALSGEVNTNFIDLLDLNVYNEDLTALTDGSKTTFTTAALFKPTTLRIYKNGSRLRPGASLDFIENTDGNNNGISFTLAIAPATNTPLLIDLQKANT